MSQEIITSPIENRDAPLEEISSDGVGSGLEAERSSGEDVNIKTPFDPREIDVITQGRTVALLLTRLKERELDLSPDFQRRSNLWGEATKSSLIESLLLRIPIPSLYVAEDKDGNYTVVDGLQRMCAIAHFVDVASLNKAVDTKLAPLRLVQLASLKEYERQAFEDLPRPLQRRINETELTLHVIRAGTPAAVKFNIFSRINRGGLPLTAQEIRNAVYRGDWRRHVRLMAESRVFKTATENKIKGERMEDLELMLRFAALFSQPKGATRPLDQTLDDFLNDFAENGCATWSPSDWDTVVKAFEKAMVWAPKVFSRMAFRKYSGPGEYRRPINRGLFEAESVTLAHRTESELAKLSERSAQVINKFGACFKEDIAFQDALLYATGKGSASNKRLEVMEQIFIEVLHD
jgi:hypothetical protein